MMRRFWRKNDGLTLVELMVSIAIGTMIFAAATTVLLLGFRIHGKTTDSIEQQYTARMVVTMLEDMASDGDMGKIKRELDGSWWVYDDQQHEVISYSAEDQAIYVGSQSEPVLTNIVASYLILNDKNVLTISLEDPDRTYSSSIFCRVVPEKDAAGKNFEDVPPAHIGSPNGDSAEAKQKFLAVLTSQVGVHGGIINHDKRICSSVCDNRCHKFNFFSQWYINGYENNPGWSAETPWCGCFVSWGLCHVDGLAKQGPNNRWFANVDTFMDYFRKETTGGWKEADTTPAPGDLIFFDMVNGSDDNPSHMGAVLDLVKNESGAVVGIKTIEGNSADVVAIREYSISDPKILGYGDPWAAKAKSE